MRIERLKAAYDIQVQWVFFPLHPETPDEGQTLEELFRGRGFDLEAMDTQMKARMEAEGLEYGQRTHTYNSRLAQELAKWADSQSGFDGIHDVLYRSYFVDGENIGNLEVLVRIAETVGLPRDEARRVLESRSFKNAVDEDWQKSRRYGVTGIPTFACQGEGIVGAQPYEVLEGFVRKAGASARTH